MTKTFATMTLAELTAVYNQHAAKPVKKFSCSKEEAIAKIKVVLPKTKAAANGIGEMIKSGLKGGMKPADVLAYVKKAVPECATTLKCVYWYSSRINRGLA